MNEYIDADEKKLEKLVRDSNKKIKQNIKQYKDNVRHTYDEAMIQKFKDENPEKAQAMRQELIDAQPYLKYNLKTLEKKLDKIILPPILEKPDGYFYSITSKINGVSVNKTYGGYHLPIMEGYSEAFHETDDWAKSMIKASDIVAKMKGGRLMIEMVEDLLDELSETECTVIKAIYGIAPFSDCDIDFIKTELKITEDQLEEIHQEAMKKLRKLL